MFPEILDYLLQFIGKEAIEVGINRVSEFLTKIVTHVTQLFKNKLINFQFSQLVLLHRSENFLIIEKPYDLLINSNVPEKVTVQTILKIQFPELLDSRLTHDFYFAHRLDYSTSGILCLPINKSACIAMCKSLENRTCEKYYLALVNGHVRCACKTIELDIGDDVRYLGTSKKMCTNKEREFCINSRKCKTHLVVLATGYYDNRPVSKILLRPITGRRHQLRVHCKAIGHPILGDYTYGFQEDKLLSRMFLHAKRLVIPNYIENIDIETDDPFEEKHFPLWKSIDAVPNHLTKYYEILAHR